MKSKRYTRKYFKKKRKSKKRIKRRNRKTVRRRRRGGGTDTDQGAKHTTLNPEPLAPTPSAAADRRRRPPRFLRRPSAPPADGVGAKMTIHDALVKNDIDKLKQKIRDAILLAKHDEVRQSIEYSRKLGEKINSISIEKNDIGTVFTEKVINNRKSDIIYKLIPNWNSYMKIIKDTLRDSHIDKDILEHLTDKISNKFKCEQNGGGGIATYIGIGAGVAAAAAAAWASSSKSFQRPIYENTQSQPTHSASQPITRNPSISSGSSTTSTDSANQNIEDAQRHIEHVTAAEAAVEQAEAEAAAAAAAVTEGLDVYIHTIKKKLDSKNKDLEKEQKLNTGELEKLKKPIGGVGYHKLKKEEKEKITKWYNINISIEAVIISAKMIDIIKTNLENMLEGDEGSNHWWCYTLDQIF